MVPLESTTCQCGSGEPGTWKSLDRVSTVLPPCSVAVTVPPLTALPVKGRVIMSAASAVLPANGASAASAPGASRMVLERSTSIIAVLLGRDVGRPLAGAAATGLDAG